MEVANAAADAIQARHGSQWLRGNSCEVICMYNYFYNSSCSCIGAQLVGHCVDMRLRPGCGYIHGYYAGTTL